MAGWIGMGALDAAAQFGAELVFDPVNLIENAATAAQSLEQINNQVRQLQNEAEIILNQIEDLKQLDFNTLEDLARILERIDALMRAGEDISYEVETSERRYEETYPESYEPLENAAIVEHALEQWRISRRAFGHSVTVQSGIVSSIADARGTLSRLVEESQGATGNLSVAQAGNQLVALSVEQQMQMQSLMAAHYRMEATERARRASAEAQSRILHERFVGERSAYTRGQ
ncbi:MAG: P-type conjugative transfer protein TrbJ [Pseudomonadota bacterium]